MLKGVSDSPSLSSSPASTSHRQRPSSCSTRYCFCPADGPATLARRRRSATTLAGSAIRCRSIRTRPSSCSTSSAPTLPATRRRQVRGWRRYRDAGRPLVRLVLWTLGWLVCQKIFQRKLSADVARPDPGRVILSLLHRSLIKSNRDIVAYGIRIVMYLGEFTFTTITPSTSITQDRSNVSRTGHPDGHSVVAAAHLAGIYPTFHQRYCMTPLLNKPVPC